MLKVFSHYLPTHTLQQVLFEELDMPKTRKTKSGYTTDAAALADLQVKNPHPFLDALLAHRDANKLRQIVETLIKAVQSNGRIHTTLLQIGASTGRLASTDPNLQNIPVRTEEGRRIREAFTYAPEFETLMTADYSQIEMRIMAHLSGDPGLIEAFNKGEDLHRFVAEGADTGPIHADVLRENVLSEGEDLLLIDFDEVFRPVGNPAFEYLVGLGKLLVYLADLRFRPPPVYLRDDAGQRDREVHGLRDVVVGAAVQGIDDVLALCLGGHHDDRQRARGMLGAYVRQHFEPTQVGHHHVQQDEVERLTLHHVQGFDAAAGVGHMKALALEAALQYLAVLEDVVNDEKTPFVPVGLAWLGLWGVAGCLVLGVWGQVQDGVVRVHRYLLGHQHRGQEWGRGGRLAGAARLCRQGDCSRGAQAGLAVYGQLAAHQLAIPIGQGKPEPGLVAVSARGFVFGAAKGFKQARHA